MNPEITNLLTWEDVKEIVNAADSIVPDITAYPDERKYYKDVLKRLRDNLTEKQRHYLYLVGKAEGATGYKATRRRDYQSVLTRSFVSYRLWKEGMTYMDIGRLSGKAHATIMNQVRNIADMMTMPSAFKNEVALYCKFEESLEDGEE